MVDDSSLYHLVVGSLQYIFIIRPKLAYIVNKVCQFMHQLQKHHSKVLKRILRYLVGTMHYDLHLRCCSQLKLQAFADTDWGSNVDDHK